MSPALNPDYEFIYTDEETDKVFLKNQSFKNMVSLSKIEFDIIKYYIETPDHQKVYEHFAKDFELSIDLIYALVAQAEGSGLLITEDYILKKEKLNAASSKRANYFIYWLFYKVKNLLNWFGVDAKMELRGNFKYFRILSFNLKGTLLEKFSANRVFQGIFIVLFLSATAFVIIGLIKNVFWGFFPHYTGSPGQNYLLVAINVFGGYMLVTFLHEMGHFIMYKRYGGVISEMGIALMIGVVPTPFITTSSLLLWKSRARRILVIGAGIMVDTLVFLTCLYVGYMTSSSTIAFYAGFFLIMATYRLLFNINPFLPRTDGYYVMCDIIEDPGFHGTTYLSFKSLITKFKTPGQRNTILNKEIFHSTYFLLSMLFMIINYILLFSPMVLILYGWYKKLESRF